MSEIELRYVVPVIVTVDTETKRVTSVNVQDEDARSPLQGLLTPDEREALEIAEDSTWPEWELGN